MSAQLPGGLDAPDDTGIAQPPRGLNRFVSLRVKLLVGFTLVFSLVFAVAYWWFYTFATEMAINRVVEDMEETLAAAAHGVDAAAFVALTNDMTVGQEDPRYQRHLRWLQTVRAIEPRAVVYTFAPAEEPYHVFWIGDVTVTYDPDNAAHLGEPYFADPDQTNLYNGLSELTVTRQPYGDKWGRWVSAYRPLTTADGAVIGGIGIDFEANYVSEVQQSILDTVLIAFVVTYAVLLLAVWLVARIFTAPIVQLTAMAERVGEGDYEQDFTRMTTPILRDEIDTLARVFVTMVDKVQARETQLRTQVEQLTIEVNAAKREEEVAEIVSSDFFQDLQAKAEEMRQRNRRKQ